MKSTPSFIIALIGFLGLTVACNEITKRTEQKIREYTAKDSVQVKETLVRENNEESVNRELDLKYPNGVYLRATDYYDDGTIDNVVNIETYPPGKVKVIQDIEYDKQFMGIPLKENIEKYLPRDRLIHKGKSRTYITDDNIIITETATEQGSQFDLFYNNGVHFRVKESYGKINSIDLISNPQKVAMLNKFHPDQEFMKLPQDFELEKYFSQEWQEQKNENNPKREGVVFKTRYIPAINKGFLEKDEESKFIFSIDSGKVIINVLSSSSKSLEDMASSLKEGSKIRFETDKQYTKARRYLLKADEIEIF